MSNRLLQRFREYVSSSQFNALRIGLASPEKIRALSYGEVKKIETINYRTLKPERDGLFCARIFGPVKDWECNCGKYKRMKHRGITCEKCGVEVIQARVRRERMGHIELVTSVCHIWYLKGIPSYLGLILDMPIKDLERVIYFDAYVVIRQGKAPYPVKMLISGPDYDAYTESHPEDKDFKAEMGAEAIKELLKGIDLVSQVVQLKLEYEATTSMATRHKLMRRIKVFKNMAQAELRPEWMILDVLPVLPPDLRPLVPLEGGRFASSDLNELYRRVLNRNIRLQRLMDIDAPSVIIKNEKRMLQESVDALIDNGRRGQPVRGSNKRPLKSLSEMLRGKQGRFRQNLLGKRVDYSGRSVIVVDPELRLDQCGLPKIMALELFKSHVYARLLQSELAPNLRVAKRMVEEGVPEVWDALESVVANYPVLLNRAPTLHRLGIQAFYPLLVDGKAIKIHPLVCAAYNADFDGDQMAVHIPLSIYARQESERLVLSVHNLLSAANGKPVAVPSQDMILGLHYMSKVRSNAPGEGIAFGSISEVVSAYQYSMVALHARIRVRIGANIYDTTVGRVLLYEALPSGSDFNWVNRILTKRDVAKVVEKLCYTFGNKKTAECLDRIKKLGFYHSTMAGISFSMDNLLVPGKKVKIVADGEKQVGKIEKQYMDGLITNRERYSKVLSVWQQASRAVESEMTAEMAAEDQSAFLNKDRAFKPFNSIFMMLESGAKGSSDQVKQLAGMRGLMSKPSGEIMETPITRNFREGLTVADYFNSTHGARKGQADVALKTANSGYLTRRLVDVAQDVTVTMIDCGSFGFVEVEDLKEAGDVIYPMVQRVYGRVVAQDVKDPISGKLLFKQGAIIGRTDFDKVNDSALNKIQVRSVLTCQAKRGVCSYCYGFDLSKGEVVDIGATVGTIAAQSIGEPGTQLTLRTFHLGGTASLVDRSTYEAKHNGIIVFKGIRTVQNRDGKTIVMSRRGRIVIQSDDGRQLESHAIEYGSEIMVKDGSRVKIGAKLVEWDAHNRVILSEHTGRVKYIDLVDNVTVQERYDETTNRSMRVILDNKSDKIQPAVSVVNPASEEIGSYFLPTNSYLIVNDSQDIAVGDILVKMPREASRSTDITTGSLPRIAELFEARAPKDPAVLADIDGKLVIGGLYRGQQKISIVNESESVDYLIPRTKQLTVYEGERVNAGDKLTAGSAVLHDLLRIMGPEVLKGYLVNQIQQVYRLQGIDINDKHIELIVRQMLRKVRIVEPGATDFLVGDRVDRIHFKTVNEALQADGKRVAIAKPVLMGITLASLGTESFISAASFQETTRILADAAISGMVDHLYGLKENVIIGKLIPAGTGVKQFRHKYLKIDTEDYLADTGA